MYPRKPPRSRGRLHAKIQQLMPNFLMFFYKDVGNAPLIPTYSFWGGFPRKLVKLCQGIFPLSVTYIVPVGWVKPPAAYPAKTRTGWKAPKDLIDFQH